MKTYALILVSILNAMLLIGFTHNDNQKIAANETQSQGFQRNNITQNESFITVNGNRYSLKSDPCVPQDNDDLKMLTFKAGNDEMDYTITVNLGAFNSNVDSGNYIYSDGETQVNFAIVTFVTENGTFVNSANSVVVYSKNGNNGHIASTNMSLMDHFETLPNMTVSFSIYCVIE